MNPKVDGFIGRAGQWQEEMKQLRKIALACGLTEELKWGKPCYTFNGKNVVIIQGFKAYCALLFFKGILLSDPDHVLVKIGQNTHVGRQIRFTDAKQVAKLAPLLKAYIYEAIEVEAAGIRVPVKKKAALPVPDEFKRKLKEKPALKKAFDALTAGRQRAYLIHFAQAKQSKTRASRIEKWAPQIMKGKGLND